jgi:hypothetical protein
MGALWSEGPMKALPAVSTAVVDLIYAAELRTY